MLHVRLVEDPILAFVREWRDTYDAACPTSAIRRQFSLTKQSLEDMLKVHAADRLIRRPRAALGERDVELVS